MIDTFDPYKDNPSQAFGFEYALQMYFPEWQESTEEMKKSDKYDLIYDQDGYLLFRRKK